MDLVNAETLNCPMCGAPASTDAAQCAHCGARLATVACPSCFGLMFAGAKFCSHCGARADRTEAAEASNSRCPRCRVALGKVVVGATPLQECPKCEGIWVDAASLEKICSDRERQADVLGMAASASASEEGQLEANIRYVPCPICNSLMNRVNFARCSHVVVDVCAKHGTWFDKDELRRIVEFIRGGGLERSREKEMAELDAKQRELRSAQIGDAWSAPVSDNRTNYPELHTGISAVADLLLDLFPQWRGRF